MTDEAHEEQLEVRRDKYRQQMSDDAHKEWLQVRRDRYRLSVQEDFSDKAACVCGVSEYHPPFREKRSDLL